MSILAATRPETPSENAFNALRAFVAIGRGDMRRGQIV
jgi:hypothetical protein